MNPRAAAEKKLSALTAQFTQSGNAFGKGPAEVKEIGERVEEKEACDGGPNDRIHGLLRGPKIVRGEAEIEQGHQEVVDAQAVLRGWG